jgi:hypothetical protein
VLHRVCPILKVAPSWVTLWHFFLWRCDPTRVMASSFTRFLDHTQRRITVGRTPLDEWSTHRRDLYLKTHNTHKRQTSMPPVRFEPTISADERPQTYALDRAVTGTGCGTSLRTKIKSSDFVAQRSCHAATNQVAACWTFDFNWALLYRLYILPYVQFRLAQNLTGAGPSEL